MFFTTLSLASLPMSLRTMTPDAAHAWEPATTSMFVNGRENTQ